MGTIYSISRIGTFGDCRLRYKYQYVDRLKAERETIEAFMGSRVHEALQELYGFVRNGVVKPQEWLIATYEKWWTRNLTPAVKVVHSELTPDDYFRKGRRCLEDYYRTYAPFDRAKVVATEKKLNFHLHDDDGREVAFCGYIDRLDWDDREGVFEIHDYKTSGSLPGQEKADSDEQLGLYHLAIRNEWPDAEKVRLVWHYLVFNREIVSGRTPKDLKSLEAELVRRVREIEACSDFPPTTSALCDWCGYQDICPEWKHPLEMNRLPENEFLSDEGVVLVAKYAELEDRKKALEGALADLEVEKGRIEEAAAAFAEREGVSVIDGPDRQLIVSRKEEICAPLKKEDEAKWQGLRKLLLDENKYEDVSTINNYMLVSRMRGWPAELLDRVRKFLVVRIVRNIYLRRKG
ncbi:MAG: RecB family exonuclease [Candidatus Aminicenantales bacterium]